MFSLSKTFRRFLALDEKDDCLLSQAMFLVPLGLLVVLRILTKYTLLGPMATSVVGFAAVRWACLVVLLLREVLFGRWNRKTILGLLLFAYMAYAANVAGFALIRDAAILVFFGRNVPFRKIVLTFFVSLAFVVVLVSACALSGLVPDTVIQPAGRSRHHLGFSHPNAGPALAFFVLASWVAWRGKKFGILDVAVGLAVFAPLFMLTGSRTSFALAIVLMVLSLLVRWCPDKVLRSKAVMVLSVGSVAICAAVALVLCVTYDPAVGWMQTLNSLLSGRLALGHSAIVQYGFAFFPQKVNFSDSVRYDLATATYVARSKYGIIVDCVYVKLALSCGVPFLVLAIVLATVAAARCFKSGQWHVLVAIACVALFGISETHCAYYTHDAFLFLMGGLFYSPCPKDYEVARLLDCEQDSSVNP